jgi:exosortase A
MTGHDQPSSPQKLWLVAGIVIVVIIFALQDTFAAMFRLWIEIDTFNHCLLIAPISAWLIWRQRHVLATIEPSVSLTGLIMVALVAGIWMLGAVASIAVVQDFAAIGLIPLSIWGILGTLTVRAILFPLGYLLFLVPFGEFLIPPLMEFTAEMTVAAVRLSGVAIYQDGLYFAIPNGSFRIIEACSGIRMLMAGVAVGALFAYLNFRSWRRRVLFLLGVVFLAIIANWVRAYIIVMVAHFSGMDLVADHVWLGYVVFAIVITIMLWVGSRYSDIDRDIEIDSDVTPEPSPGSSTFGGALIGAGVIVAVVVSAPLFATTVMERAAQTINHPVASLPGGHVGWSGPGALVDDWQPEFQGDLMTQAGRYQGEAAAVDMYIISYQSLSQQSELINATNRIFNPEKWMLISETSGAADSAAGESIAYFETEIQDFAGIKRLVRHWYVVDGVPYNSRITVKLIELSNTLAGRPTAVGVVAVSTRFDGNAEQAARVLDTFLVETIR